MIRKDNSEVSKQEGAKYIGLRGAFYFVSLYCFYYRLFWFCIMLPRKGVAVVVSVIYLECWWLVGS